MADATKTESKTDLKPISPIKALLAMGLLQQGLMGPAFCQTVYCGVLQGKKERKDNKGFIIEIVGMGGKSVEFVKPGHKLATVPVGHVVVIRKSAETEKHAKQNGFSAVRVTEAFEEPLLIDAMAQSELQSV